MKIINNFPKLTKLDNIENELTNKAPIEHSNSDTSYGAGSSLKYGHVKLSDSYKTSDGTADSSVAASSKAVVDSYNDINNVLSYKLGHFFNIYGQASTANASSNIDTLNLTGFCFCNFWVKPSGDGVSIPSISNTDKMGMLVIFSNYSPDDNAGGTAQLYFAYDGTIRYRGMEAGNWSAWRSI